MEAKTRFSAGKGIAIALPFLLFFAGVFCLSMYLFQSVVEETAYFGLLVGDSAPREVSDEDTGFTPGVKPEKLEHIPSIRYGKQFARLNVTWDDGGWDIINVPVYLGSDKRVLKKGAGMSFGSYFPGEGKCTIISAHVTRSFAELEDTPVGAIVLIETSYGPYAYRVEEKKEGVKGTDRWYMDAGQNVDLVLYTCYPRDNGGERRTDRCVLLCRLIDGAEVTR
ncbi:MAG: sortase [Clostridia bacterium]|jgi:sortase A|nr:sortase [Clostridia bacterium]MBR0435750.1 sortase [Clostridia bacterium]MBR3037193.1 sortase [Clostridia bacterium]